MGYGNKSNKIISVDVTGEVDKRFNDVSGKITETDEKLYVNDWELSSKQRSKKGITVFVSDDGRIEEYTKMKPIHETEGVPLCLAVVKNWIGTTNFCDINQLKELEGIGWEMLSHTLDHPYNPVIVDMTDEDAEAQFRDSKTALNNMGLNVQSLAYVGGNYGKRERGFARKYYRSARCSDYGHDALNHSPIESHELKTFWIDTTAGFLKTYLNDSNRTRAEAIADTLSLAKSHIDSARDKNALLVFSTHTKEIDEPDLLQLWQDILNYAKQETETMTLRDALNQMGNLVEVGDFSKMGLRAKGSSHFALGADGRIDGSATVADANEYTPSTHFNLLPFGVSYCPVNSSSATQAPEQSAGVLISHKVSMDDLGFNYQEYRIFNSRRAYRRRVNADKTFTSWVPIDQVDYDSLNRYDPSTPLSNFPSGVTYNAISYSKAQSTNAPEGLAGHLITYNLGGLTYQEYRIVSRDRVYGRYHDGASFESWRLLHPRIELPDYNDFDHTTPLDDFPIGTTYSIVSGLNPNISTAPSGENGTLVTHKAKGDGQYGYNYQEYHLFDAPYTVHKRRANDGQTWSSWVQISAN